MRRFFKWLLLTVLALACLVAIAITYTIGWRPFLGPKARPLTSRAFDRTPQRLERGRHFVTALANCFGCHSPHEWNAPGMPLVPGQEGAGSVMPITDLPGRIVASNLTPDPETGAGRWTDDQLARAIREGIGHDGRALFPMMPYQNYRRMSDEDLALVIVYLRSLPPVRNELPPTEIIFPVKYLIRGIPSPLTSPVPDLPASASLIERGELLAQLADCNTCHTPLDKGQDIPGMDFAGGFAFPGSWGTVASANITPDPSGISYYDESLFLEMMHTGSVKARKLSPLMPTTTFRNLSDDDLKAIFAYLRTLKPVHHRVDNSEPATFCKLCRQKHGAGDQN